MHMRMRMRFRTDTFSHDPVLFSFGIDGSGLISFVEASTEGAISFPSSPIANCFPESLRRCSTATTSIPSSMICAFSGICCGGVLILRFGMEIVGKSRKFGVCWLNPDSRSSCMSAFFRKNQWWREE